MQEKVNTAESQGERGEMEKRSDRVAGREKWREKRLIEERWREEI